MVTSESGGRMLPTVGSSIAGSDEGFKIYALLVPHDRQGFSLPFKQKCLFHATFSNFLSTLIALIDGPF